jgi:hypothetical protein
MSVKRDADKEKERLSAYNEVYQKLMDKAAKDVKEQKGGKQ